MYSCLFVESQSAKDHQSRSFESYRSIPVFLEKSWMQQLCLVFVSRLSGLLRLRSVRYQESGDNSIEFQIHAGRLLSLLLSYHAELRTAE